MGNTTYVGLGDPVREFEILTVYVRELVAMQSECTPMGADDAAIGIALDGLETAAYHFTRRRHFYHAVREYTQEARRTNHRLQDRAEAIKAFKDLAGYHAGLNALQQKCRPFGRDYLALDIAKQGLETAAYHFTRHAAFYGLKGDGAGPATPTF